MAASGAVTRSTLRQQIAGALRDEVLAGRLCPGKEFTVKEIAEQYGVSATPVREAMVDLAAQGLLDSVQHRGFCVREFSLSDYEAMIEARSLLAEAIFRGLAARGVPRTGDPAVPECARDATSPVAHGGTGAAAVEGAWPPPGVQGQLEDAHFAQVAALRRRGEEASRAAQAGDLAVLIGYDLRFWNEASSLYGNPYLTDFLARLRLQSWACVVPVLRREPDLRGRLWAGHPALVDALVRRDVDAAYRVITEYNMHGLTLMRELENRQRGDRTAAEDTSTEAGAGPDPAE